MTFIRFAAARFSRVMRDERGFLQSLIPFIPAAVSLFTGSKKSSGGGSAGSVETTPNMPDWQYGLGENLSSWASKFLNMYNPGEAYKGDLTAKNLTGPETAGLGELGEFMKQPATGELFNAAKGQVMDTLNGKYADPNTSPFIQSYSKLANQNLTDSINTERGRRGARGTYFTRAGVNAESQLQERTQNFMNTLIGDFLNTERGRQFAAVGEAQNLEGFAQDSTIKRVTASQTLGSLERLIEQSDLEAKYDAWINQRTELGQVPQAAQSVFGTGIPTTTTVTPPRAATSGNDVAPWVSLAMQILPKLMGQGR